MTVIGAIGGQVISVTQLRNQTAFVDNDEPLRVIKYTHTHLSRGAGTIKVKVRSLRTGRVSTKTYKSGKQVEEIEVVKRPLHYLYREDEGYKFMDPVSFEQLEIKKEVVGEAVKFLTEGEKVEVLFWVNPKSGNEEVLDLDLPIKMTFEVVEAAPGEKGDSASNVYKDAKLENGLRLRVPLFVKVGDKVRVDTRTGEYVERASG